MVLLGIRVTKNVVDGKEYVRRRGYFARNLKDSNGSVGLIPTFFADFNNDIDTSRLVTGVDYVVETYDYKRVNKSTGEVYEFRNVSSIAKK